VSEQPAAPVPSPLGAAILTLLAWAIAISGWMLLLPDAGPAFSLAVGLCVGFGGVGTIAARSVPPPAELRLGLRGLALRFALPIALVLPAIVLASELDNLVRPLFPELPLPEVAEDVTRDPEVARLAALEFVITLVLLRPVLEEFFFRGVVQQGLVAALGPVAGVIQTALLSGLASGGLALPFGPDRAASAGVQAAFLGVVLGLLRHTSGSLLAPIVAAVAMSAAGVVFAALLAEAVPIPGFNAGEGHTPLWILGACAAPVALGCGLALRFAAGAVEQPPDSGAGPPPTDDRS
jgi:membrane protease YdiL (CAAX protease family)